VESGPEGTQARKALFDSLDVNKSGNLTLDDVTSGIDAVLETGTGLDLGPLVEEAYARSCSAGV
jgi:hypothetical protein